MTITEKWIDNVLVKYLPETDVIFLDDMPINGSKSYTRTLDCQIYDTCIEITTYCNQECINCFAESSNNKVGLHMRVSDIERCINKRMPERIRFTISGGEPFLHPHISSVLEIPRKYPLANYWINTNGYINDMNRYLEAIQNNGWNIAFSIHGTRDTHNTYTKSASYNIAEENLMLFSKFTLTHIYSVINEFTTSDDINHLIELKERVGSHLLRFIVPRKFGRTGRDINMQIVNEIPLSYDVRIKRDASNTEFISIDGISRITH